MGYDKVFPVNFIKALTNIFNLAKLFKYFGFVKSMLI